MEVFCQFLRREMAGQMEQNYAIMVKPVMLMVKGFLNG